MQRGHARAKPRARQDDAAVLLRDDERQRRVQIVLDGAAVVFIRVVTCTGKSHRWAAASHMSRGF